MANLEIQKVVVRKYARDSIMGGMLLLGRTKPRAEVLNLSWEPKTSKQTKSKMKQNKT